MSSFTSLTANATNTPFASFLLKVSHENATAVALIFVAVIPVGGTDGAEVKQNTKSNLYGTMILNKRCSSRTVIFPMVIDNNRGISNLCRSQHVVAKEQGGERLRKSKLNCRLEATNVAFQSKTIPFS